MSLRSPPLGSLAKEILASGSEVNRANSILNDIKNLKEQLSDFGSCISSSASSSDEDVSQETTSCSPPASQGYSKKSKRKQSRSPPDRTHFSKKLNSGSRVGDQDVQKAE